MLYDHKVLLEENVIGREIECGVLGNENPQASLPGEILPNGDFYSYETKYIDENDAVLKISANLSEELKKTIQKHSVKAFEVLERQGLARVDYFTHPP